MQSFENRKWVIIIFVAIAALLVLGKLFYIQVIDDKFKTLAANNAIRKINTYPARGLIFDRNGKLIVGNRAVYDLVVIPREVKDLDTTQFCQLLKITEQDFNLRMNKAKKFSYFKASLFASQIPPEEFVPVIENMYQFNGFYSEARTIRTYPYANAAHLVGYTGEISESQLKKNEYYKSGDYIGINGLEKSYEHLLRGKRGVKYVLRDKFNREVKSYMDGDLDEDAISGISLQATIDIELQRYGEKLMQNKRGSVVAIEPSTGEILAMISSPGYNPNLLTGRDRGVNYKILNQDSLKPLFNRPIMATYPPGSTFKAFVGLVALENKAITENTYYACNGGYSIPGRFLKCSHGHASATNVQQAIRHSCNPYFWNAFRQSIDLPEFESIQESYTSWYNYADKFNFGKPTLIDVPYEKDGNIPDHKYYDRLYGKRGWGSQTIISLGIGQGEVLTTPLQLSNMMAIFANEGYYYPPHLIKPVKGDTVFGNTYSTKLNVDIEPQHFTAVNEGLLLVVQNGTARIAQIDSIDIVGKTGTAENPHGTDHSVFVSFAPLENPKIAIAAIVENGGYGSRYAAPIASLMTEFYMNRKVRSKRNYLEEKMFNANLLSTDNE